MADRTRMLVAATATSGLLAFVASPLATAAPPRPRPAASLLSSRDLWATIDVCNPRDQPNTVGIRGSMPGDGKAHDRMYMSFTLQYREAKTGRWVDLTSGASAAFVAVGGAGSPRQGGRSFQLMPAAGKPFVLRGVVAFQWRRGRRLMGSATRTTTAGHNSLAGADPAGFSAASCRIG
jgi:hypothetical protein